MMTFYRTMLVIKKVRVDAIVKNCKTQLLGGSAGTAWVPSNLSMHHLLQTKKVKEFGKKFITMMQMIVFYKRRLIHKYLSMQMQSKKVFFN